MQDDEIVPLLRGLRYPTFFTLDSDFFDRGFCHKRYCLVCMDVRDDEVATFVKRLLRHPQFDTKAKRMGKVMCISPTGIRAWALHAEEVVQAEWTRSHPA